MLVTLFMSITNQAVASQLTQKKVEQWVAEARKQYDIPALAVVVSNTDSQLISIIQGVREAGSDNKAQLGDDFHIGSSTKSILALVAADLIEQGKITWQSRFFDVLPQYRNKANNAYHNITLKQLLAMRAGIKLCADFIEVNAINKTLLSNEQAFINYLLSLAPATKPEGGAFEYAYSNASPLLVAAMLAKVSGKSWRSLLQDTMVKRFDIQLNYGNPQSIDGNHVVGHVVNNNGIFGQWQRSGAEGEVITYPRSQITPIVFDSPFRLPEVLTAAGDTNMSVLDYAKYAQVHLQGARGQQQHISAINFKEIQFAYPGMALGVMNSDEWGEPTLAYAGSAGSFYVVSLILPTQDVAIVIMANNGSELAIAGVNDLLTKMVKKQLNYWWAFWL